MSKLSGYLIITCAQPGLRRAGVEHPAIMTWPADTFSAQQLDLLRAEPKLTVVEADAEANIFAPGAELQLDQGVDDRLVIVLRAAGMAADHVITYAAKLYAEAELVMSGDRAVQDFRAFVSSLREDHSPPVEASWPMPEPEPSTSDGVGAPPDAAGEPTAAVTELVSQEAPATPVVSQEPAPVTDNPPAAPAKAPRKAKA